MLGTSTSVIVRSNKGVKKQGIKTEKETETQRFQTDSLKILVSMIGFEFIKYFYEVY